MITGDPSGPIDAALVDRSGTITTGGTAQTASAAKNRYYLLLQNIAASDLWVNFGAVAAVATAGSIRLAQYDSIVMEQGFVSNDSISVIGPTTGQAFTLKEA